MSQIEVKIVEDSISTSGKRITTFQLKYHRFIHGELMTHRVFSRNASSSRAIPVKKILSQVWNDPAMPTSWASNKSGMQAGEELGYFSKTFAQSLWKMSAKVACVFAWGMMKVGLHKQWANRILEPWQFIHVVLTSTEFDNFFQLRCHPDAQPEIQILANEMRKVMGLSIPRELEDGQWHLPYIGEYERKNYNIQELRKISTSRCCRVSYLKHDGSCPSIEEDLKLYDRLVGSKPIHASPAEHQAEALMDPHKKSGNLIGWRQYRTYIEAENLGWR